MGCRRHSGGLVTTTIVTPNILTATGRYFSFVDPEASEFDIRDIAHALSNTCRFAGHVRSFYSVAQHSDMVSRLVPPEMALAGLLHDAAEAFIGDVTRPLKQLLPEYKTIERRVERAVFRRFGLPETLPPEVKRADMVMLATERRDLMPDNDVFWPILEGVEPLWATLHPQAPAIACANFLHRYEQLTGAAAG